MGKKPKPKPAADTTADEIVDLQNQVGRLKDQLSRSQSELEAMTIAHDKLATEVGRLKDQLAEKIDSHDGLLEALNELLAAHLPYLRNDGLEAALNKGRAAVTKAQASSS